MFVTEFQRFNRPTLFSRSEIGEDGQSKSLVLVPRDVASDLHDEQVSRLEAGARRLANSKWKRVLDILGAALGILIMAPLFMLVAAAIMIESPGSALFRQRRTGYLGAPFVIYKFRSMRVQEDGPTIVQAHREDGRITRMGLLLRRTSVDELPQLLNVLKGEMSLVGPRPALPFEAELFPVWASPRYVVAPGLTGLWQVRGRNRLTMLQGLELDVAYVEHRGFLVDLRILFRTVPAVLGRGAR